eukprot:7205776-Prymnesium_polylepis.1
MSRVLQLVSSRSAGPKAVPGTGPSFAERKTVWCVRVRCRVVALRLDIGTVTAQDGCSAVNKAVGSCCEYIYGTQ